MQNGRKNFGYELWSVGVKCEVAGDMCFAKSSLRLRTMSSVGSQCEEDLWMRIVERRSKMCGCKRHKFTAAKFCGVLMHNVRSQEIHVLQNEVDGKEQRGVVVQNVGKSCGCEL